MSKVYIRADVCYEKFFDGSVPTCRVSHTVDVAKMAVFRKMSDSMVDHQAVFHRLGLIQIISITCNNQ